jgi:hypothetical protein
MSRVELKYNLHTLLEAAAPFPMPLIGAIGEGSSTLEGKIALAFIFIRIMQSTSNETVNILFGGH